MKRLFGAPKSSTRHLPSDDTAPPISHAPEDTWTPLSQPPPSSDSSPHFTPPTGPPPPLAPSPTPHSSPPTTGGAPARRTLFSFGRKENPVEESQQQQGGGEQQYNHASAGWSGGNMMIAAQPSAPRPVGPPRVNNVAGVIGWSCAAETFDFPYILALCDHVSLDSAVAKEAARCLRKELKYGAPEAQERAVRLTGIMMRNADLRFKQQIASKKFVAELSDLCTSKKTEPRVRAMVLRVLSLLAYEYQRDSDLSPLTTLWNKLKPPDGPINGCPLDPEDPLFVPTADPRRAQQSRNRSGRSNGRMPTQDEELENLRREAMDAKGSAAMLSEAVAFTPPEELSSNEIVSEFLAKCLSSQDRLSSSLSWATVAADRSRASLLPLPTLSSNNPFAPILAPAALPPTTEEATLALVLAAHTEVGEAIELHSQRQRIARERRREEETLKSAQELSIVETRFDREKAGEPDEQGNYGARAAGAGSSSRDPSPNRWARGDGSSLRGPSPRGERREEQGAFAAPRVERRVEELRIPGEVMSFSTPPPSPPISPPSATSSPPLTTPSPTTTLAKESRNPYAAFLTPATPTSEEPGYDTTGIVYAEEPEAVSELGGMARGRVVRCETGESEIVTPAAPSAKALGKLRRVSMRTDSDPGERERELEERLREKYKRDYEEERRRSGELERE